ncbi:MAG: hypothetical protein JNJ54_11595 [Myxococcaceae bacterium]|nr:hypothetical protein [Myxococcaceae bacterium]
MRWLDTPPCVPLEMVEPGPGTLVLRGPTLGYRVSGGAGAVFGGAAAAFGLRLSRVLPGPMKLVPLGIAAVGGAVAAVSSAQASVQVTVEVSASGLVARWRLPLLAEKELRLAPSEVAGVEVKTVVRTERAELLERSAEVYEHRVCIVTRDGRELPLDTHSTRTQADLRRAAIEGALAAGRAPG